jgi:hypothetical protein
MPTQAGKNLLVAYKVQPTKATAPGTGSAKQLRIDASPGLSVKRQLIENPEVRSDGLTSMPRLGSREVPGSYNVPVTVGGLDDIIEAVMRSTWVASVAITQATMTSITTTTSTIVAAGGSWITQGVRKGDIVRLTSHSTAANNSKNLRVLDVSATTITVPAGSLTTDAVADATFTLTILKKLKNATSPTKRAFYIEEYNQDIDVSEVFDWVKFIGIKIVGSPNGSATAEVTCLGADGATLASGASPYYISPTLNTGIRLVFADATVSFNGTDVANCVGFEINIQIAAKTEPVVGSTTSPDVFDNDMKVTGSLTFLRQDLANVGLFINETEVQLHILLVEPESEPKDCLAFYIGRVKLTGADAPLGNDGGMMETLPFTVGKSESVTGVDDSMLTISTSAP